MQIKFLKREKSFKKKSGDINPDFYWSFIFFMGFFLTLIAFAFGFYLLRGINKEPVLPTSGTSG